MATDKVETLLGFAIKAGYVIFGSDAIERCRKRKYLIMICHTMAENSREKLIRANANVTTVISRAAELAALTHKAGCKALCITDKQMAQAITDNMNGTYQPVTEVK